MANINKRALNDALSAYPFLDSSNFTAHGTGELEHDGSSHSNKGKRQKLAVK
jgi:hypothetical protein